MSWLTALFFEPVYRLVFGPPASEFTVGSSLDANGQANAPRGLVIVADGVGGMDTCGTALAYVMGAAKLPYSILIYRWGHGLGRWLADLTDRVNLETKAETLADTIRNFQARHPREPVFLVAKSGGSGVAIKALERLGADTVERAVFLAPAVSPAYDLTAALRAVRREIVVFWSPLDVVILGAGTRVFGTIDRVRSASAGMVGFKNVTTARTDGPPGDKLRHVRWRAHMVSSGHFGGHFGPDNPLFLRKYVVPLLRVED